MCVCKIDLWCYWHYRMAFKMQRLLGFESDFLKISSMSKPGYTDEPTEIIMCTRSHGLHVSASRRDSLALSSLALALWSLSRLAEGLSLFDTGCARPAAPRAPTPGTSFLRGLISRLGRLIWGGALTRNKKTENLSKAKYSNTTLVNKTI